MTIELSRRLEEIASYIPPKMHVADIGGDHAFLLLYLAQKNVLEKGIVGEKRRGPYQVAQSNIIRAGYQSKIEVRLGDGLSVLNQNEVDVIVIAGMGGLLLSQILDEGQDKLKHVKRLVLQANNKAHMVREWLYHHHFQLVDESIIEESGKLYEVIVAEPGEALFDCKLSREILLKIGPVLWKKRHPHLKTKLENELIKKRRICANLRQSESHEAKEKCKKIEQDIIIWEEAIQCLSTE